ncbi:hypothetical protein [Natronorubrum halophilum]|uniref:hypothetical protein n=1 Tax=Natronorubrum halophilum TaxID=1702106 RepID=UPI0010C1BEA3|nr:hypothetical protein [Natronorubrum halophilum]
MDRRKLSLIIGFCSVTVAVAVAHNNPATGYELSVYNGTPVLFWIGVSISLVISVFFSVSEKQYERWGGILLGALSVVNIYALPLIRGYHFVGPFDSMTHWGLTKDLVDGTIPVAELLYPGSHLLASAIHFVTSVSIPHSMMLVVYAFLLSFILFVPLVAQALFSRFNTLLPIVALYSAFLLLPINHVAVHLNFHPTSHAIMYSVVPIYCFIRLIQRNRPADLLIFLFVSLSFILIHPQQAANLLLILSTVVVLVIVFPTFTARNRLRITVELLSVLAFYLLWWVWINQYRTFETAFHRVIVSTFIETVAGERISDAGVSLAGVGASVEEIFAKLFLVSFIYCLLSAYLLTSLLVRRTRETDEVSKYRYDLLLYFMFSMIPVTGLFVVYLSGNVSTQYLRHFGFIMAIVTVFGSIGIIYGLGAIRERFSLEIGRETVAVIILLFLVLSVPIVHTSPYLYRGSGHVTEAQMHGYDATLDTWSEEVTYADLSSLTFRYGDATEGFTGHDRNEYYGGQPYEPVPDHFANQSIRDEYEQPKLLTVSDSDRAYHLRSIDGERFDRDDFEYIETEPGVHHVHSSDGFDLYYVE